MKSSRARLAGPYAGIWIGWFTINFGLRWKFRTYRRDVGKTAYKRVVMFGPVAIDYTRRLPVVETVSGV